MNNVLPVLHGSMYNEVDTVEACFRTSCQVCAYQLHKIDNSLTICPANCEHKFTLSFVKETTL